MGLLLFVLSYICSFFFLSRFFVKDISTTVSDRNFKSGIQVYNDKWYCEIANGHSPICSSLYLFFSFSPDFFVKDISTTVEDRNFKFGIEVCNDKLYCEIANGHSPICSSLPFSFFPDFSSKISLQPFQTETSNLVYRFTTTSCIAELKKCLLLFVLP